MLAVLELVPHPHSQQGFDCLFEDQELQVDLAGRVLGQLLPENRSQLPLPLEKPISDDVVDELELFENFPHKNLGGNELKKGLDLADPHHLQDLLEEDVQGKLLWTGVLFPRLPQTGGHEGVEVRLLGRTKGEVLHSDFDGLGLQERHRFLSPAILEEDVLLFGVGPLSLHLEELVQFLDHNYLSIFLFETSNIDCSLIDSTTHSTSFWSGGKLFFSLNRN